MEEALIFLSAITNTSFPWMKEFGGIHQEIFFRFREFQRVLAKYRGDRKMAKAELKEKFGNTYWYYVLYNRPLERGSETPSYGGKIQ